MGGAINFDGLGKEKKWRKIFGTTIAGSIRNIYSTKDYVLLGYSLSHMGKNSAGRNRLNFEEEKSLILSYRDDKLMQFKNYNITHLSSASNGKMEALDSGHLDYRGDIMSKVFTLIQYW